MKKLIIIFLISTSFICFLLAQETTKQYVTDVEKYISISPEKLLEIADEFAARNAYDSALVYYSLIYNNHTKANDTSLVIALNRTGNIFYRNSNYKTAFEMYLKALKKCETIGYNKYIWKIYHNLAIIHIAFKGYEKAKNYLQLAEKFANEDEKFMITLNKGVIMTKSRQFDSAMYYYREAYILKDLNQKNRFTDLLYNNMADIYLTEKKYDSAIYYFRLAVLEAEIIKNKEYAKAEYLQNIGVFYLDLYNYDSAIYYFDKCRVIAEELNLLEVLSKDNLLRYKIAKSKGNKALALLYQEKYVELKDSIFNIQKYGEINQLEMLHDMEENDKQIQQLFMEQEVKERTINLQRTIQIILSIVVLIIILILIFIYRQNRKLNDSYQTLVDKNIEIVNTDTQNRKLTDKYKQKIYELEAKLSKTHYTLHDNSAKTKSHNIEEELYNEIKTKILEIMDTDPVICNSDFSIYKLAELVNSNQNYVSTIINESFGKNFKSFVNEYRIKNALKFLQQNYSKKYKIEYIAAMSGFESRNTFDHVFKENVGVTPSFFFNSLLKKESGTLQ